MQHSEWVLASGNKGKCREFQEIIQASGIAIKLILITDLFPDWDIEETGTTFDENALLKAEHASKLSALPAFADDSGLEVDALNGEPGVYSARYGGSQLSSTDRYKKILDELQHLMDPKDRGARFKASIAWLNGKDKGVGDDPASPYYGRGALEGTISSAPKGSGGFGYDPIFIPNLKSQDQKLLLDRYGASTLAEWSAEDKNKISHRGEAFRNLMDLLKSKNLLS